MQQQDEIATADQLLAEWRAQAAERLPTEGSMVRRMLEKGLQESEALVDKVKQAGEMCKQIEGLPGGVVKEHMSKALGQLEAELAATVAGLEEDGTGAGKGTPAPGKKKEAAPAPTPSSGGDTTYELLTERLAQTDNSVQVKGPKDALALAVHVLLQEEGFVCYGEEEQKGGPTGFAPPIRLVSRSRVVPPRWNADPANVCFTYRHDGLKGRDIKLKILWMDEERVVLELQDTGSGGNTTTMTINGPEYVKIDSSSSSSSSSGGGNPTNTNSTNPLVHFRPSHLNPLASSIHTGFITELLPTLTAGAGAGAGRGAVLPTPTPPPSSGSHGQGQRPPFDIPVPNPLGPMVPPGYAGYGRRGGGLVPDFEGDLQPGGGWGGPGGGNLMGPGHPIFTGGMGEGGGLGMPQPRFDPYGPVISPSRGGQPMPPGRGGVFDPNDPRGPGRAFREPDPDHLPPPGPPGTFGNSGGRGGGGGGNFYF